MGARGTLAHAHDDRSLRAHPQRQASRDRRTARQPPAARLPALHRDDREQARLRRGRLRRVHGRPGRDGRARRAHVPRHQQLHHARPHGRGARDRDGRGPRRRGRRAAPRAGGDGRPSWVAVRLLHAGLHRLDDGGVLPRRRRLSGEDRRPAPGKPLPLHRLPPHPGRDERRARVPRRVLGHGGGRTPTPPGPAGRPIAPGRQEARRRDAGSRLRGRGADLPAPHVARRAAAPPRRAPGGRPRSAWTSTRRASATRS